MKKLILFVSSLLLVSSGFAATKTVVEKAPAKKTLTQEVQELKAQMKELQGIRPNRDEFGFVVTSPYVGIRATYDSNDLLVNLPSVNEDFKLLQQRQAINDFTKAHNMKAPDRPVMNLSGLVEGQGLWNRDFTGGAKTDVNLSRAELQILGDVNRWVTGFIVMSYDNDDTASGARVTNSRIYLNRGFITVGNFNESPVYGTLGQIYVPFGAYSNFMVTTPLTQSLARTKERAVVVGYNQDSLGLYGAAFGYRGDTYVSDRNEIINGWGLNLGYGITCQDVRLDFGAGYINNIAESEGMQDTGGGTFAGFGKPTADEQFRHFVPAVDLRGALKYDTYDLVAEYIGATRGFDQDSDMMFNGHGATPQALDVEANYNFRMMDKLTSVAVGYGRTWEALAINLPKHSAFAKFGVALWRSTIESIEYRHDWNYGRGDTASGGNDAAFSTPGARTRDMITAQIGVYF